MKIAYGIFFLLSIVFSDAVLAEKNTINCTVDNQTSVEVTIYNNNLGLINEQRNVLLPLGEGELQFRDIASHIIPETVFIQSALKPENFSVLEQTYEYDLINSDKLLDKYVGKEIKLIIWHEYQDRRDIVDAILLSNDNGQIFKIKVGDTYKIFLGHPGIKVLPKMPEDLVHKPTLKWIYRNNNEQEQKIQVSYLTNNLNWKADYTMFLSNDTSADLSGWATIENESGTAYQNAKLKLIAGDVHRVKERRAERVYAMQKMSLDAQVPQFEEQPFFEYHAYDLQRNTTLKNNQTKQIHFAMANAINIQKEFLVPGNRKQFTGYFKTEKREQHANITINFVNSRENNLGIPLPAGIVRLYLRDKDGNAQFIGEDKINHTPKDEQVRIKIGEASDIVAERKQTDYRKISSKLHESNWEITVRNHKDEEVNVGIIEPLTGNWEVIENSHPFKKADAFTIRFDVIVPADEEITVTYRVQVGL